MNTMTLAPATFRITASDATVHEATAATITTVCEALNAQGLTVVKVEDLSKVAKPTPPASPSPSPSPSLPDPTVGGARSRTAQVLAGSGAEPQSPLSTWAHQVVDEAAKARIEAQHAVLVAGGVAVDAGRQLYGTGTRMADVGYRNQENRRVEHDAQENLIDAAYAIANRVTSEGREDRVVSSRDFAKAITVNGKVAAFGYALSEQALRGITTLTDSPSLRYLLGLRDRISANVTFKHTTLADTEIAADTKQAQVVALDALIKADKAKIAEVLYHELMNLPEREVKMRTRKGLGDIFAILAPSYAPADAPQVVDQIIGSLPADAKGSWAYNPTSTSWELRAAIWTPTPVAQQAVGEPFQGYASFSSKDNGTGRFHGGGGVLLLACLNASTYVAEGESVSRIHRGRIMLDMDKMLATALKSIDVLCDAWGTARASEIAVPETANGRPVTINDAIPGFYRHMLTARSSDLVGVLPGRTEANVVALTRAFTAERRDQTRLVRSDLAQGWTRMIQDQPTDVRRDAEVAIADWLTNPRVKLGCDLRTKEGV